MKIQEYCCWWEFFFIPQIWILQEQIEERERRKQKTSSYFILFVICECDVTQWECGRWKWNWKKNTKKRARRKYFSESFLLTLSRRNDLNTLWNRRISHSHYDNTTADDGKFSVFVLNVIKVEKSFRVNFHCFSMPSKWNRIVRLKIICAYFTTLNFHDSNVLWYAKFITFFFCLFLFTYVVIPRRENVLLFYLFFTCLLHFHWIF